MITFAATHRVCLDENGGPVVETRRGRHSLLIQNFTGEAVFLGPEGVTSEDGIMLPGVQGASLTLTSFIGALHGVTARGAAELRVFETF